jgi:hypothetical protein
MVYLILIDLSTFHVLRLIARTGYKCDVYREWAVTLTTHVLCCPAYKSRRTYTESRHIFLETFGSDLFGRCVESQKEFLDEKQSEGGVALRSVIVAVACGVLEGILKSCKDGGKNEERRVEVIDPDFEHLLKLLFRLRRDESELIRVRLLEELLKTLYSSSCHSTLFISSSYIKAIQS